MPGSTSRAPYVRSANDVIAALRHQENPGAPVRPGVGALELTTEDVVVQMFDENGNAITHCLSGTELR